jgi:hypothetical protein
MKLHSSSKAKEVLWMPMRTNNEKAEKAIEQMPLHFWYDVRSLAKTAKLGVQTMSRFLVRAKREGKVENKNLRIGSTHLCQWRRIK